MSWWCPGPGWPSGRARPAVAKAQRGQKGRRKKEKKRKERKKKEKAYSTRYSQAVSHPSTNQARPCLASEIRRDRARSGWYGRRRRRVVAVAPQEPAAALACAPARQPARPHAPTPSRVRHRVRTDGPTDQPLQPARQPACQQGPPQSSAPARNRAPGPGAVASPTHRPCLPCLPFLIGHPHRAPTVPLAGLLARKLAPPCPPSASLGGESTGAGFDWASGPSGAGVGFGPRLSLHLGTVAR